MSVKTTRKDPKALQKVYESMSKKGGRVVAVGFPSGKAQAYPSGTGVAAVAAFHVYGMGVPRRDFMGLARDEIVAKAIPILNKSASYEQDSVEAEHIREAAGQAAVNAIKRAIVDLKDPPNAPKTVAAKGSSNPLIDTSHMLQSVTYVVRKNK